MTEQEWLASTDPTPMLEYLHDASDRKLRLLVVASGRLVSHGNTYPLAEAAFSASEQYADHQIGRDELRAGRERAILSAEQSRSISLDAERHTICAAEYCAEEAIETAIESTMHIVRAVLGPINDWTLCQLAKEIFGNPFRPVSIDPEWLTSTVVSLAEGIYAERAFDHMPILSDALQDAGCEHEDILSHLRGPGPHRRGCWAIDLLLGKS